MNDLERYYPLHCSDGPASYQNFSFIQDPDALYDQSIPAHFITLCTEIQQQDSWTYNDSFVWTQNYGLLLAHITFPLSG